MTLSRIRIPCRFPAIAFVAAIMVLAGSGFAGDYSVILISVDGLRSDALTRLGPKKAPNFFRLRNEGAFTGNARTAVNHTVTLPNHTGMITSRLVSGPNGHGWTYNKDPAEGVTLHSNKKQHLASMFSVAHDHGLRTALFASKSKFSLFDLSYDKDHGNPDITGEDNGRDKIDLYEQKKRSEAVVDELEDMMGEETYDLLMLHIRNPDTAGHAMTWETRRPSFYLRAVEKSDELLGDVLEHAEKDPGWKGRTFIVLTSDHGGLTGAKGHSDKNEPENFTIPFFVWGPGITGGTDLYALNPDSRKDPGKLNPKLSDDGYPPIRNAGAGNFCLSLLGLPPIPGSTINLKQDLKSSR